MAHKLGVWVCLDVPRCAPWDTGATPMRYTCILNVVSRDLALFDHTDMILRGLAVDHISVVEHCLRQFMIAVVGNRFVGDGVAGPIDEPPPDIVHRRTIGIIVRRVRR